MATAKCKHEASVFEYAVEETLLKKWAKWIKREEYATGYGVNALRPRTPGEAPIADDLADRIDTAICMCGPFYRRVIKHTYLLDNHDYEAHVQLALDTFRSAFSALESVDRAEMRVKWWRGELVQ